MKSETKKSLLRLKELTGQAGKLIFERVKLAAAALDDHDWIAEVHGDQEKAGEALNSEYFADIGSYVHILKLVAIFNAYPLEKSWQEYRYNLRAMEELYDSTREVMNASESPKRDHPKYKELAKESDERATKAEYELKREREVAESRATETEILRRRVRELEQEVATFKGRLEAYERMLPKAAA